jgi:cobalt/nickel transport system permease protein
LAGYTPKGMTSGLSYSALLPDYSVSGLPEVVGYVISAILGVAILVIIFKLLGDRRSGSAAQAK